MAPPIDPDQPTQYGEKAKQEVQGWYDAGLLDALEGVVNNGIAKGFNSVLSLFFSAIDVIIVLIAKGVFAILGELDPAFGTIASLVVGNMFEVEVDTSAFTNLYDGSSRKAISKAVGDNLLKAFKGDQANVGPGELQPSTAAAETYLGVMANLALEGWTFEVFGGMVPFVHLDHLGALKDAMTSVLGLGRMSRAVLRPFVNTLVATPALWAVNKQYRPKMLAIPEAIRAFHAGQLDELTMREIAARDGFGDDAIEILLEAERKRFSAADLGLLVRLELRDREWAIAQLRATGLDVQEANDRLVLEDAKNLRTYQLEAAQSAVTAYGNRLIDDITLAKEIDQLGLDRTTLDRFHAEALRRRRLNVQRLHRADVEAAIELEILSVSDYDDWLEANGYSHDDALTLQLLLLAKLQKLEDARTARSRAAAARESMKALKVQEQRAARDRVAAEHAHWTGTLGEAERLVVRNIMPPNQYRQVLVDHGLSPGDADALTTVAVQDRDDRLAAAQKRLAAAAKTSTPIVSLQLLERGVVLGKRSLDDFRAELVRRKYSDADAQLLVALVQQDVADRAAAQTKRDAAAAALQVREISLAQLEAAVLAGERPIDDYRQLLTTEKYSSADVATLVALLEQKVKDRALADERHRLAEQKLAASHLTLADEEKAVLEGIVTFDDYTLYLEAHGFDVDDQAVLTALLFDQWQKKNGGA